LLSGYSFILASGSPRRRELLASLGIGFTVMSPDIDETDYAGESAVDYVRRISREKALAVCERVSPPALILAADTTVILDKTILAKPANADAARDMLRRLRGRDHQVCTGMTLARLDNDLPPELLTEHALTTATMRDYSDAEIEAYIATGDPFDKAGGYAIQHEGFHPVASISGSYSNVVGLALETLEDMLDRIGG
jgi:MAF protein